MKDSSLTPVVAQPSGGLSPLLLSIIEAHLTLALRWFSDYVYQRLLGREANHPLVQWHGRLDFSPLEEACADYHQQTGLGRPVSHTVAQLLRALLIKYVMDYSLRQLEFYLRHLVLFKWFAGYHLFELGPDHTTLHRFEVYLYLYQPRLFFDTVLRQIDATWPKARSGTQIGDTFALHANAALESLIQRLRHTSQQMLLALHATAPDTYATVWSQLDQDGLFGAEKEKLAYYLSTDEWRERLGQTVVAVLDCLALVQGEALAASVQTWRTRLEKILSDELRLRRDEQGQLTAVALLPEKERGARRLCSATDPDATIRNHGAAKKAFGYNISLLATPDLIRAIQADTGSRADVAAIAELLRAQKEQHDLYPDKLIYDQIAGTGKTAAAVAQASHGQTQLVAKPMPYDRRSPGFGPQDFRLSDDGLSLTCPNSRTSRRKYRSGSGDGFTFRFMPAQCLGCPLLTLCRGADAAPTTPRNVFISDYTRHYLHLVAYSQTNDFKADMKLRPHIERIIAALVLHNGARRARFRGQQKVDFQVKMAATAYNLKRWLVLLAGKTEALPRPSRRHYQLPAPSQSLPTAS